MNNFYCSNCGCELEKSNKYCPNCGCQVQIPNEINNERVNDDNVKDVNRHQKTTENWINTARFVLFIFVVIYGFSKCGENWTYIFIVLFGFFLSPYTYYPLHKRINKVLYFLLTIFLPLSFLIMFLCFNFSGINDYFNKRSLSSSSSFSKKTPEEEIRSIFINKMSYDQELTLLEHDSTNGTYSMKITYKSSSMDKYNCASGVEELIDRVNGVTSNNTEKIKTIEVNCKKDKTNVLNVKINNVGSYKLLRTETKYYDAKNKEIKKTTEDFYKEASKTYKWKDIMRNPYDHYGEKSYWFGKVLQVINDGSSTSFRIGVDCKKYSYINEYYCDNTIYVEYSGSQRFIEDDMVKVWGDLAGNISYTSIMNQKITIPGVKAKYMQFVK